MQQQHLSLAKNPDKIKYVHRDTIPFSEHEEPAQKKTDKNNYFIVPDVLSRGSEAQRS